MILNVTNDSHLVRDALRKLQLRLVDSRPLMGLIGAAFVQSARKRIAMTKQAPNGQAWRPLSQRTIAERAAEGRNTTDILRRTSALLNSIQIGELTANRVVVGTPLHYAGKHQFGDPANRIPARPFIGLSDEDKQDIEEVALSYVRAGIE